METLTNNDAIMIMLKKYLFMNYFASQERFFIRRKITTVLAPWKIVPQRLFPTLTLKKPSNLNPGGDFWGQSSGGNFPVTNNNISLLRMLIKKKANENSVSIETFQQKSLESTGKTELSLNYPTQKESGNFHNFHQSDL